jgi:hypothetical protein
VSTRHHTASPATGALPTHRLRFGLPVRLGLLAAAGTALLVLAMLMLPGDNGGPGPVVPPSTSVQPSETSTPTGVPTPSPTATPTPTATPIAPSWTGLAWSDPVVPFPYVPPSTAADQGSRVTINDLVEWKGAYVGVGAIDDALACSAAGFFTSADGLSWDVSLQVPSGDDRTPTMCPRFVVVVGDELVAIAQERIWRSADGISWSELDASSLRSVWTGRGEELVDVAATPGGIVIVGKPMNTHDSIIAFSRDGATWAPIELPADGTAIAWDATAHDGGFVIVGRDGEPDGSGSPAEPYTHPGVGSPAAWISSDGATWTQAAVDGGSVVGGTMTRVVAGAGGLFAVGNDTDLHGPYEGVDGIGITAWHSADGRTWAKSGMLDDLVPGTALLASDGADIVAVAATEAISISPDGLRWSTVTVSGDLRVPTYLMYPLRVREVSAMTAYDIRVWATAGGLVASYMVGSPEGFAIKQVQVGRPTGIR